MSDVIANALKAVGIEAMVTECDALITSDDGTKFIAVGLQNNLMALPTPAAINTHVIVIIPHSAGNLLIDSSINHLIPDPYNLVFGRMSDEFDSLARYRRDDCNISYLHKLGPKLPTLHDLTVKQRLAREQKAQKHMIYMWLAFAFALICLVSLGAAWYSNYIYISESRERAARNAERMNLLIERMNFIEKQINEMNNRYMTIHDSRNIENAARDRRIDELQQQITQQGQTLANTRNLFMEHMNGDLKSHSKQ